MDGKLGRFVKFYSNITNPDALEAIESDLSPEDKSLLGDTSVPLLFIFNGADNVTVWSKMKELIKESPTERIRGHPVVTVFCPLEEMVFEKERLEMAEMMRQKDEEILRLEGLLKEKDNSEKDIG